jgi:heme exporter protein CcmD
MSWLTLEGHGVYVWCAYGVSAIALALQPWLARRRRRALRRREPRA